MSNDTISLDVYQVRDIMDQEAQNDAGINDTVRGIQSK
jgi:hypothetical protein